MFNVSQIPDVYLRANTFRKMPNLRYLKLYHPNRGLEMLSHVHLPRGLKSFPNKLSYLEWCDYPLKSLPTTFCPVKLVKLCMPGSHVQNLWNGVQVRISIICFSFFFSFI